MIKEPVFYKVPSKEDFYYDGDSDERYALGSYYGKDIDYLLQQCKLSYPLTIMDVFYFVGTRAFRYYIFSVFRYLQEAVETVNQDMLFESPSTLLFTTQMIDKHLQENPNDMQYIVDYIKEFSKWVIVNYDTFDVSENVFGDLKEEWKELSNKIEELYKA